MKKEYKKLELDKILLMLADQAYSEQGREKCLSLTPSFDIDIVKEEVSKTQDAFMLSSKFGTPRFYNVKNITGSIHRAQTGSSLSLRELLDIAHVLREINGLCSWHEQCSNMEHSLSGFFHMLTPEHKLETMISNNILSEEEISDNASPELSRIRRAILKRGQSIREQLDKLIKSRSENKFLQESIVTQRDGRFVVPVKAEYRSEIPGLVHDTSSSGATYFIEPMSVVEANNEIRILKIQEAQEVERIIAEMSAKVAEAGESILISYQAAIELEFYFTKANFGAKMRGVVPEITENPVLVLKKARHPLIDAKSVVPIDIELGLNYTSLIITGPNTGGKTVALKTAGLFTLMAMCGLMLPASDGTQVGIFTDVYADIGDEQSIEQSLSTFSSHINNIIHILDSTKQNALVLLDELGSGTDPVEGAALAVSILNRLKQQGCFILATTHYQEVKLYAIQEDGVENASCEFDVETLKPTYRLVTGVPGKSNAFAIASRLGMKQEIIEAAKELIVSEDKRFEEVIDKLEQTRIEMQTLKEEAARQQKESAQIKESLENQLKQLQVDKEKELNSARQKAIRIIEQTRMETEKLVSELEQLRHEKDKADFSERTRSIRSKVNKTLDKLHDESNPIIERKQQDYKLPRPLKINDSVLLVDINKEGTLLTLPDQMGNCMVLVGIIRTKTNKDNLRLIEKERVKFNGGSVSKKIQSNMTRKGSMELDIRGMTADEGIIEVDRFIDNCLLTGLRMVTIIHGKGTGVLKNEVRSFLKTHKNVKNFRPGVYGEGEDGVTVAELE